jgi:hypothetical protein
MLDIFMGCFLWVEKILHVEVIEVRRNLLFDPIGRTFWSGGKIVVKTCNYIPILLFKYPRQAFISCFEVILYA